MDTGIAYMVVTSHDLHPDMPMPSMRLQFGPGRSTVKWRGKRFNLPRARVIGFDWGPAIDTSNVTGYRGEPEVPGGPAEWGAHSLSSRGR